MIKIVIPISARSKPRGQIGKYGNMTHSSKGYREWQDDAIRLIRCMRIPTIYSEIYALHIIFYKPRGNADLDNLAGGVMDLLCKAGVLVDDKVTIIPNLFVQSQPALQSKIEIIFTDTLEESISILSR